MASAERRARLVPELPCIDVHVHLHPERLARAIERWFAGTRWVNAHPFDPAAVEGRSEEQTSELQSR